MKIKILSLVFAALATVVAISCSKEDDPAIKGSYKFYEPLMDWTLGSNEVAAQMKGMSGWKKEKDDELENELCYVNNKTKAEIRYEFRDGKLSKSSITYYGCNDKFEQMKEDWTNKLKLVWKDNDSFQEASCAANHCSVTIQSNASNGISYMIVEFSYTEFIWPDA